MAAKNVFFTGLTELLFLSILAQGDSYVYDITKTIEDFSGGLIKIPPNTIYTAAYKMEQDGMISEYSTIVGRKRTRIYYHLEPAGRAYLKTLETQYREIRKGVDCFFTKLSKRTNDSDIPNDQNP